MTIPDVLHPSRAALLDAVLDQGTNVHLIVGPFGVGKSELLRAVSGRLTDARCTVLRLSVPDVASADDDLHAFRQCLDMATQVADQLADAGDLKLSRGITSLIRRAQFNPITINQSITAEGHASIEVSNAQSVQLRWGEHLTMMESILSDEVVGAVVRRTRRTPVAVIVDDAHNLDGTRAEQWLMSMLRRAGGVRTIIARRPPVPPALSRGFSVHRLGPLPREDVAAYLHRRLGTGATDTLVDLVGAVTGRLPWGVTFVTEQIINAPDSAAELAELHDSDRMSPNVADLVDVVLARLDGDLRHGLDQLSVLRDFDRGAAAHMLHACAFPDVLDDLRQALLVDVVVREQQDVTRSSDLTASDACLRIPDVVRAAAIRELRRGGPDRTAELHRRAAAYYNTAVERESPDLADPFRHWSAIEGGVAQRYFSEWIYHVANASDTVSWNERARILRWYFEAFFWYEWKVAHWFCQRLLDYCQVIRRTNARVGWLDLLHRLHEHYPRGWRKDADAATWRVVIDALAQLRGYVHQPGPPPGEATDGSQAYALTTHLLAESMTFARLSPDTAADRYREAGRWYVGEANVWCRTYIRLHLAQHALDQGDPSAVRSEYRELLEKARDYSDIEMFCHVLRMRADERWASGHRSEALAANLSAVLHALAYQARQLFLPEMVHFPDAYTRELYHETIAPAAARIDDLDRTDPGRAAIARRSAADLFAPFWGGDAPSASLFPPPPDDADLGLVESDYVSRIRWLVEERNRLLWNPDVGPATLGLEET